MTTPDPAWSEGPTLSAWIYDSPRGAVAGKLRLDRLSRRGAVTVVDAATLTWVRGAHRPLLGWLHQGGALGPARRSPLQVLLGRLILQPGRDDPVPALVRELAGSGLEEPFLRALRDGFAPDGSALLVLSRRADLEAVQLVIERGRARGDVRLLLTPLAPDGLGLLAELAHRSAFADG